MYLSTYPSTFISCWLYILPASTFCLQWEKEDNDKTLVFEELQCRKSLNEN